MGCSSEWGGSPLASSMAVMPRDQMSAWAEGRASASAAGAAASAGRYLGVVGRLFDDLGGHPEGRSHEGVAFDLSVGELSGHAEVGQLHLPLLGQQHVGGWGGRAEAEGRTEEGGERGGSGAVPLMSLWIFFSECRYSRPLRISLRMVAIWVSSRAPGSIFRREKGKKSRSRKGGRVSD